MSLYGSCERQLVGSCNVTVNTAGPSNCSTGYAPLMVEVRLLLILGSDGRGREGVGRRRTGRRGRRRERREREEKG